MKQNIISKKGLTVKDWVIISLMFSAIFAMGVIAISGYQAQSGLNTNITDPTIQSHYGNNLDDDLNNLNQSVQAISQPGGLSLISGFQAFFGGTVAILNIVFTNMGAIPLMFVSFATDFGIDSTVASLFFLILAAILTIIIIFAILNSSKSGGRV